MQTKVLWKSSERKNKRVNKEEVREIETVLVDGKQKTIR